MIAIVMDCIWISSSANFFKSQTPRCAVTLVLCFPLACYCLTYLCYHHLRWWQWLWGDPLYLKNLEKKLSVGYVELVIHKYVFMISDLFLLWQKFKGRRIILKSKFIGYWKKHAIWISPSNFWIGGLEIVVSV